MTSILSICDKTQSDRWQNKCYINNSNMDGDN